MAAEILAPVPPPSKVESKAEIKRRSAGFHPNLWGEHFLTYSPKSLETDERTLKKLEELKEQVRKLLEAPILENPSKKLYLINNLERLGVAYHFEDKITEVVKQIYDQYVEQERKGEDKIDDLFTVALRFRLFRQQSINIPSETLRKHLKDSEGKFKESLVSDVKGMLSLYEATILRIHNEEILEEAFTFTTTHLQKYVESSPGPLATQVVHALNRPLRRGMPRLEATYYFTFYEQDPSHSKLLLTFAKLDFNVVQKLHKKELAHITQWWKDLEVAKVLPWTRNRNVECFFWIQGVFFEPEHLLGRRFVTKVIAVTSMVDDLYDVYATLDELDLFTKTLERWDINDKHLLPEFMQFIYQSLMDIFNEAEELLAPRGQKFRIDYLKKFYNQLLRAYYQEAKWYNEHTIPPLEEYVETALLTTAYPVLVAASFIHLGDAVTKEALEWLYNDPRTMRASSAICRFMDDIVSHDFEQSRGHVVSAMEIYRISYGIGEVEGENILREKVKSAWKDINEEFLYPTGPVHVSLLTRILNFSRAIDVIYKDDDGYTNSNLYLKDYITTLFVNPMHVEY